METALEMVLFLS